MWIPLSADFQLLGTQIMLHKSIFSVFMLFVLLELPK
jgi:hypothetical protein